MNCWHLRGNKSYLSLVLATYKCWDMNYWKVSFTVLGCIAMLLLAIAFLLPKREIDLALKTAGASSSSIEVQKYPVQQINHSLGIIQNQPAPAEQSYDSADQWRGNLANSNDARDIVLAAAISRSEEALFDALAQAPNDPMLLFFIADHCLYHTEARICDIDPTASLTDYDPDNAAIDVIKANQAMALNQHDVALHYLEQAIDKPEYDDYSATFVKEAGESMVRFGVVRDQEFLESVMGHLAALPSKRDGDLMDMCQQRSKDQRWYSACQKMAEKMWNEKAFFSSHNAIFLYQRLGLTKTAEDLHDRFEVQILESEANYQRLINFWSKHPDWEMSDSQWREFVQNFEQNGSFSAFNTLTETVQNGPN